MNGIIPHHIQILRTGWFPATFNHPQKVFTFNCLNFYHELTLQGKVNAYDFCQTLQHLTDTVAQKTAPMFAYYTQTHVLLNADIISSVYILDHVI